MALELIVGSLDTDVVTKLNTTQGYIVRTLRGNDYIGLSSGNDIIRAGSGNDIIESGDGRDKLYGDSGNDSLRGGGGKDLIEGGDGIDTARYADGYQYYRLSFYIQVNKDIDVAISHKRTVMGLSDGADAISEVEYLTFYDFYGSTQKVTYSVAGLVKLQHATLEAQGSNSAARTASVEMIEGSDRSETILGTNGSQSLMAGDGDDTLDGGVGRDYLLGGRGADSFRFSTAGTTFHSADRIVDFSHDEGDIIDLSEIDASSEQRGNNAFMFIETDKFSSEAGELRYVRKGDDLVVMGDIDGDGVADFKLHVMETDKLSASDFVL